MCECEANHIQSKFFSYKVEKTLEEPVRQSKRCKNLEEQHIDRN